MHENEKHDEKKSAKISAETTIAWLKTPEGAKHFEEKKEKAKKFSEQLQRDSQVDRKVLSEPMTI
jgi:hypothetical protein